MTLVLGFLLGHFHGRFYATDPVVWESRQDEASRPLVQGKQHGWKSMDIYVGRQDAVPGVNGTLWYSQVAQDELIIGLLRGQRNGRFVDLAANDATVLSNTYALEKYYGWSGLCIEPNPTYWKNLTEQRTCQVVGAVVGGNSSTSDPILFRYEAGDHGGIAGDGFDNGRRWQAHSLPAYTVPLDDVLERFYPGASEAQPVVIDYLSLDVEGAETFILKNFSFKKYAIKIITAERLRGEIRGILKGNGFSFKKKLTRWGESLWVHESVDEQLDWRSVDNLGFPR